MADITEQIVREAPEIEAYKIGLLQSAKGLTDKPVDLPAYQVSGFSPDQIAAFEQARQGIGSYQPFLYSGAQNLQSGANLVSQAASQAAAAAQLGAAPTTQAAQFGATPQVGAQQVGTGTIEAAQTTYKPTLQQYQMGPAERITTQSILDRPGTTEAYMSPYMQNVVDWQKQQARRDADIANQQIAARAVGQGAFGGSRQAVAQAEADRALLNQLSGIQAIGTQQAFNQAQQQFNAEQQARLAAQQYNQAAGLTVGQQNLAAKLGIQQLGTQTGLQTALANLSAQQQANVQNEANRLQASGMNQQAALQAALANQQISYNTAMQNAQLQQQANLANQAMQGQYGLTQGQLGVQAAGIGAQAGSQLGNIGVQQGAMGQTLQQLNQADVNLLYNIGSQQQALNQAMLDAERNTALQQSYEPYQRLAFLSDIYKGAPSSQQSITAATAPVPSAFQQAAGIGIAGLTAGTAAKKAGLF